MARRLSAASLQRRLGEALLGQSGHDERRDYLGMSGIGDCSRELYFRYTEGQEADGRLHWYSWMGYTIEAAIIDLTERTKRDIEVVAGFDERFRGHVDLALSQRDLVEIKSVTWSKFSRITLAQQAEPRHQAQVQMYLRHGGWERCLVIYTPRDVDYKEYYEVVARLSVPLPFFVVEVRPDTALADSLDAKARAILAAIDQGQPPQCDCGWCD